jgi:GNAT superfamily N-acetyltransferase
VSIELIEQPDAHLCQVIEAKLMAYNFAHLGYKKIPVALVDYDDNKEMLCAALAKVYGQWFLLEYLWVDERLRGQGKGSEMLARLEQVAREKGCRYILLDTLDFQAKPFYEKHGYSLQWQQDNYPEHGHKYFLLKTLT